MSCITKKAIACCDEFSLHIEEHCDISRKHVYCSPTDTHYIMRGSKIIASLNVSSVNSWIIRKSELARKVKSMLESDKLNLNDYEGCKKSLLETVSPRANLRIYEDFLQLQLSS